MWHYIEPKLELTTQYDTDHTNRATNTHIILNMQQFQPHAVHKLMVQPTVNIYNDDMRPMNASPTQIYNPGKKLIASDRKDELHCKISNNKKQKLSGKIRKTTQRADKEKEWRIVLI